MSGNSTKTEKAPGSCSDAPASRSRGVRDLAAGFGCCGAWTGDVMAERPCGSIMRRHPVITTALLAVMGLACLLVPVAAILGMIAFFRMF